MSHERFRNPDCAYLALAMPRRAMSSLMAWGASMADSSQETFRFHATWIQDDIPVDRHLILRRDATAGLVAAERDLEYNVYRALAGQGLPIPSVYFLELDPRWLERPFFIMDMCPGKPVVRSCRPTPMKGTVRRSARNIGRSLDGWRR